MQDTGSHRDNDAVAQHHALLPGQGPLPVELVRRHAHEPSQLISSGCCGDAMKCLRPMTSHIFAHVEKKTRFKLCNAVPACNKHTTDDTLEFVNLISLSTGSKVVTLMPSHSRPIFRNEQFLARHQAQRGRFALKSFASCWRVNLSMISAEPYDSVPKFLSYHLRGQRFNIRCTKLWHLNKIYSQLCLIRVQH